ncbi:DGQHR domain-containing protein [Flavobacterium sp. PLA-1-15]|uniref:DGQHR domain-containing protein n=1 Tax=Flavobacterium sp. PLA-1-15 TaxID=3380533 RepID=UPI003B7DFBD3
MINYTEIEFTEISQITRGRLGFAKVKFYELEDIVRFTARSEEKTDTLTSPADILKIKAENARFYQRLVNDERTAKIQQFIIGEALKEYKNKLGLSSAKSLGLFPTATLIAINTFPTETLKEYEEQYYSYEKKVDNQITLCFEKDNVVYVPKGNKTVLIVDGQHRIGALKNLYPRVNDSLTYKNKLVTKIVDSDFLPFLRDRIKNFEVLCTLLINFDIYEQGAIFASVNFNQKPVNRSLYYDIFASSPDTEKNELKLAHDLVNHLNYNSSSVLKGFIDMLGDGNGIVSQSAVMENLMKLFGRGKVWNALYLDYQNDGKKYLAMGSFLRLYFAQIKETFKTYWPAEGITKRKDYNDILLKTTGMGAWIRLINDIYLEINPDHSKSSQELQVLLKSTFNKIEKNGDLYFNKKSAFVQGAGQGLQAKLYKQIAFDLGFRVSPE